MTILKFKLIQILMIFSIFNCFGQKTERKNLHEYKIKSFNSNNEIRNATITYWTESPNTPVILKDEYTQKTGTFNCESLSLMEYKDSTGLIVKAKDSFDGTETPFYNLRIKLEKEGIQLLVKGARLNFFKYSRIPLNTAKQVAFGKLDEEREIIGLFDEETDISKIVTVKEQYEFYLYNKNNTKYIYVANGKEIMSEKTFFECIDKGCIYKNLKQELSKEREKIAERLGINLLDNDVLTILDLDCSHRSTKSPDFVTDK